MSRIRQRLKKYVLNDTRPQRRDAAFMRHAAPHWPQPRLPASLQKKPSAAAPAACSDAPKRDVPAPRAGT